MAVVLTRPVQEAERWAARLRERQVDALVLPLLAIGPAPDAAALSQAAAGADRYAAVMFVSANAVQGFFACRPVFEHARAWAPGPATREALRTAGVPEERIDAPAPDAAQFDSEHLWPRVEGRLRAGDRVLLVRGGDASGRAQGRDWIVQQLAARGVAVDTVVAYTRQAPAWDEAQRASAQRAARDGSWWLFSSSEAARHLAQLLPRQDWSHARALATHPRIAEAARALGFGEVRASRPGLDEVLASIESTR
ncbi:MAG: uroporphyrinogen-III synthase [Burkholderiales bacterium]|nr:uroporphyrinogen-III synthase [Burkholderiales bacterium]